MGRSTIKDERSLRALQALASQPAPATAAPGSKASGASRSARVAASAAGEIRIIGGQWRRTKLTVLTKPDLRPTPDRVRRCCAAQGGGGCGTGNTGRCCG